MQDSRIWSHAVSTHSRLKAAGLGYYLYYLYYSVSTHSRLKAAGVGVMPSYTIDMVSTHSRLKAAGAKTNNIRLRWLFQHTAA